MRAPRLYQPVALVPGERIELDERAVRHLHQVLRLRAGAEVEIFDGHGHAVGARVLVCERRRVQVSLEATLEPAPEATLEVELALGISRGERMDLAIQKAVELGVARIQPLATERSVVRLEPERGRRRQRHWQGIVISACEQCGRARLPAVEAPRPLEDWLTGRASRGLALMPTPGARQSLKDLSVSGTPSVALLVGPEGGLAPGERSVAEASGFTPVRLGPRILRTETAAMAAVAAVMALWGDLG